MKDTRQTELGVALSEKMIQESHSEKYMTSYSNKIHLLLWDNVIMEAIISLSFSQFVQLHSSGDKIFYPEVSC